MNNNGHALPIALSPEELYTVNLLLDNARRLILEANRAQAAAIAYQNQLALKYAPEGVKPFLDVATGLMHAKDPRGDGAGA